MSAAVGDIILTRMAESALTEQAKDLVLAAMLGQAELDAALGGTAPTPLARRGTIGDDTDPIGTYLTAIEVTGFRGVGATATLSLEPGPGLTIVTGRNGSGKSSFAEAAELALTGAIRRLAGRTKVWREGWRNLHHSGEAAVRVSLLVDGERKGARVECRWPAGADFEAREQHVQVHGQPRGSLSDLGGSSALQLYRPFLSYGELGDLINGTPSDAFDALYNILGLGALVEIRDRLKAAQKELRDVQSTAKAGRDALATELAGHADARALDAQRLLRTRTVDLDALANLATADAAPDDTVVPALQKLARLPLPERATIVSTVDQMGAARATIDSADGTPVAQARRIAGLLTQALAHHAAHGDGPCPVCGGAVLDAAWAARATDERDALTRQASALESAHHALHEAVTSLRSAVPGAPSELDAHIDGLPTGDAGLARRRWDEVIRDASPAADQVLHAFDGLAAAVDVVRVGARGLLDQRDRAWHPVARRIEDWVQAERASRAAAPTLAALKAGVDWLKAVDDDIRNDSLAPLARRATAVWQSLRQGSSVEIGGIRLAGTGTHRHLDITVAVDEVGGAALSVMSQGELHSLGLALFLPRATLPASPFRFLVIDDPVQAMDPAKVHGLAVVLSELARTRQVVVFTHDDRLPAAVRQLQLSNARVVTVTRGPRSRVQVGTASQGDPADRHLDDAMAIALDPEVETAVRLAVTAALVREAIESVCHDLVRRREYANGTAAQQIEASLEGALKLREKLALALLGDAGKTGEVGTRLARVHQDARDIVKQANEGAHGATFPDPVDFVRRAGQVVQALRR